MTLCSVVDGDWTCPRTAVSHGLCQTHRKRQQEGRPLGRLVWGARPKPRHQCPAHGIYQGAAWQCAEQVASGMCLRHTGQTRRGIPLTPHGAPQTRRRQDGTTTADAPYVKPHKPRKPKQQAVVESEPWVPGTLNHKAAPPTIHAIELGMTRLGDVTPATGDTIERALRNLARVPAATPDDLDEIRHMLTDDVPYTMSGRP